VIELLLQLRAHAKGNWAFRLPVGKFLNGWQGACNKKKYKCYLTRGM
jgi:hypothetical protein